jgi:hypothetical protein
MCGMLLRHGLCDRIVIHNLIRGHTYNEQDEVRLPNGRGAGDRRARVQQHRAFFLKLERKTRRTIEEVLSIVCPREEEKAQRGLKDVDYVFLNTLMDFESISKKAFTKETLNFLNQSV